MDQLVHSFTALAISRFRPFRSVPNAAVWAILAANISDLDGLARLFGDRLTYLAAHRTLTHSLFGFVILTPLWLLIPQRARGPTRAFLGLVTLNFALHILFDLTTSWPTYLLWPFSWKAFHLDWQFILAPFVWIAGLLYILVIWKKSEWAHPGAVLFLIFTGLYWLHSGWGHAQALRDLRKAGLINPTMNSPGIYATAIPLPFTHDHRMGIVYLDGKLYRYYRRHGHDSWQPLVGVNLTACPEPTTFSNERPVRIFFRFADTWGCLKFLKPKATIYFNARYFYAYAPEIRQGPFKNPIQHVFFALVQTSHHSHASWRFGSYTLPPQPPVNLIPSSTMPQGRP